VDVSDAVIHRPDAFEVTEVLAAVRGVLDVALERCDPGSAAALEICAAWEGLDAVSASSVTEPQLPTIFGALVLLATARRLLRGAIIRVEPLLSAFLLAGALRHLDAAAAILAAEASREGPSWA
jgi:hypothetical protein